MIEYEVTSDDIRIITQKKQDVFAKVQLLNKFSLKAVADIDGVVTDGSITIDTQSISRKSASLTMYVTDDFVGIGKNKMIWFDKYIRLYIGLKDQRTDAIKYYNMGLFLFDPVTFDYSATTNNLTLSLADLMSQFDAEKDGIIGGYNKFVIPAFKQDENGNVTEVPNTIREALIEIITIYGGIKSYLIDDIGTYITKDNTIPYDLEFDVGTSIIDVITKIRDLYPGYEAFFDNDGTFICRLKDIANNDPIYINLNDFKNYVTAEGETISVDINSVKNVIEVWGQDIYYDRYSEFCNSITDSTPTEDVYEIENNTSCYHVICEDTEEPVDGMYYAIKVSSDNKKKQTIKIQTNTDEEHYFKNLTAFPIWDEYIDDYIEPGKLKSGNVYTFLFKNGKFYYYGSFTAHGVAVLSSSALSDEVKQNFYNRFQTGNILFAENTSTQLGVDQIGIRLAESSSDTTSNINSDALALSQAEYELYDKSRFFDTISLNTILIPWLNVNTKVQYQGKNDVFDLDSLTYEEKERKLTYVVNKIDMDIKNFTMNVELTHFYSLYQEEFKTNKSKYTIIDGRLYFNSYGKNEKRNLYWYKNKYDTYSNVFGESGGIANVTSFEVNEAENKLWAGYIDGNDICVHYSSQAGNNFVYYCTPISIVSCGLTWTEEYVKSLIVETTYINFIGDISTDDGLVTVSYFDKYFLAPSVAYGTGMHFESKTAETIKGLPIFKTFDDVKEYWLTGDSSKSINDF